MGRPGRPGWGAAASCIVQLALTGGVSVVLVACVLLGALWLREGSPKPFAYLVRGNQKPKALLSASEHWGEELTPTSLSAAPSPSEEVHVYVVDSVKTVKATEVEVAYPTSEPILTPSTCVNWDPVQGRYNDRLVVVAHFGG